MSMSTNTLTNILKIDIDVKVSRTELELWVCTRKLLLKHLGYTVKKVKVTNSKKGYHIWIHLNESCTRYEIALLQFLLGDDHRRCYYNFLRCDLRHANTFNILFNFKITPNE
jgi:hypothetical protein